MPPTPLIPTLHRPAFPRQKRSQKARKHAKARQNPPKFSTPNLPRITPPHSRESTLIPARLIQTLRPSVAVPGCGLPHPPGAWNGRVTNQRTRRLHTRSPGPKGRDSSAQAAGLGTPAASQGGLKARDFCPCTQLLEGRESPGIGGAADGGASARRSASLPRGE